MRVFEGALIAQQAVAQLVRILNMLIVQQLVAQMGKL